MIRPTGGWGGRWGFGEEEEEAGGDSSSDLAESLCQDFLLPRLPRLPLSLSLPLTLSPLTHTHTQRCWSEIGSLPENSLGLLGASPLRCCACRGSSQHLPASPSPRPSPRLQPCVGQAATAQPRPGDPKCEEGPPLPPAPGRRVGTRDASPAGAEGGLRGFA